MQVTFRGLYVIVPQRFLNIAYTIPCIQAVCRKTMPQGVYSNFGIDACSVPRSAKKGLYTTLAVGSALLTLKKVELGVILLQVLIKDWDDRVCQYGIAVFTPLSVTYEDAFPRFLDIPHPLIYSFTDA